MGRLLTRMATVPLRQGQGGTADEASRAHSTTPRFRTLHPTSSREELYSPRAGDLAPKILGVNRPLMSRLAAGP